MKYMVRIIILIILVDLVVSAIFRNTKADVKHHKKEEKKKTKKERSTSSSSNEKKEKGKSSDTSRESLDLSITDSSGSEQIQPKKKKKTTKDYRPKSSKERTGWKKWHRKCQQCPEDMRKKWRDPSINWICGGYQRARRSFKSLCMMHYRNCQDGTMFTKVADHRCPNDTAALIDFNHGDHFFYDYSVALSLDSSKSDSKSSSSETKTSSTSSESRPLDSRQIASLEKAELNDLAENNLKV